MPTKGTDTVVRLTLGTNNLYALPDSSGVTLIDAGPDYDGAWDNLLAQLRLHDIAPTDVHTVLLTHSHLDHAGLAARWQSAGARIVVGRDDVHSLLMDDARREEERALARREMLRHGVPPEALAHRSAHGERYTRWPAPLRMTAVCPDDCIDDRDRTGDPARPILAVACPGHTPGTMLFLDEISGSLFTGDHVLPRMAPTSGIQFDGLRRRPSLPVYLASVHAVRRLAGRVSAVLPGHGEPMDDLAEAVDWTVRLLEQRARRVLSQVRQGPASAYQIVARLFPHMRPRQIWPAMAECIGLLDLLAERGQVIAEETDTSVVWRLHSHSMARPDTMSDDQRREQR